MKIKNRTSREVRIRVAPPPKSYEREYGEAMAYMVEQIHKRMVNGTLKALQARTVAKFADAQTGNFAAIYLKMAEQVRRKLIKQFDDDRIKEFTKRTMRKVDKNNAESIYKAVEARIGLNAAEILAKEGLTPLKNALILESTQWAKKLRDETLEFYTANSLRAMTEGKDVATIIKELEEYKGKRVNHAKFTARNQVGNYNALVTKARAQNLGITEAIWQTSGDERVRESHRARDGQRYNIAEGLYSSIDGMSLLPQTDYQCRCVAILVIPTED